MLTLLVVGARGGGGIVPVADFFVCCGSIRDLKPLTKSKKPMVKKIKVKIVDYTIFISNLPV